LIIKWTRSVPSYNKDWLRKRDAGHSKLTRAFFALLFLSSLQGCSSGTAADGGGPPDDLGAPDLLPLDCPSDVVFCDSFESGQLDPKRWGPSIAGGTLSIAYGRAHTGHYSLALHTDNRVDGGTANVHVDETRTFKTPMASSFIRTFVYLPSPRPSGEFQLLTQFYAGGSYPFVSLVLNNNRLVLANSITNSYSMSTTQMPTDRWVCVELEIDGQPGQTHVWIDGTEVPELARSENTVSSPAANTIAALLFYVSGTAADDIWYDDFIVDSKRVGCMK
jgi:hypothetical protein